MLLAAVLARAEGLTVVGEAGDGAEAVTLAREIQPDIVMLDVAMPVMDGIEALPLILEAAPRARVVMLTGFATDEFRTKALAAGAAGYLEKGVTPAAIVDAAREACAG